MAYLRAILWAHDILEVGSKDELIDWVKLLKAGHQEATFSREHLCMLHFIATGREISRNQATFVFSKLAHKIVCAWQNWNTDHQNQLCPRFVEVQQTYNQRKFVNAWSKKCLPLENKEKLCLNVFKEKTTYPTKKEKLSAKISKGRLNEFTENIRRSERKRKLPAKLPACRRLLFPLWRLHAGNQRN